LLRRIECWPLPFRLAISAPKGADGDHAVYVSACRVVLRSIKA